MAMTTKPRPLWVDPDEASYPALTEDTKVAVTVIGAGIAGTGAAFCLLEEGVSNVAVLEARTVTSGASGRNAGFVMAVAPENFPQTSDPAEVAMARRIWSFTADNQRLIEDVTDDLGIEADYRKLGSLGLAAHDEEWRKMLASVEVAREAGVGADIVPREDLGSAWLKERYLGGAWFPVNAEMHPGRFVRGLAGVVSSRGGLVFERSPVTSVQISGASYEVRTQAGARVQSEAVVLCTNAYTPAVLPDLAGHIAPKRGQMVATKPLDHTVAACPVYANDGYQYWRQTIDRRLVLGGWRDTDLEGEVGTDERLNPKIQSRLDEAVRGLSGGRGEIEFRWSGIMGFTPDRRPLVGMLEGYSGMAIAAGFSGHGIAMAFNSARQVAGMLLGRPSSYQDLFDPNRFDAHRRRAGRVRLSADL